MGARIAAPAGPRHTAGQTGWTIPHAITGNDLGDYVVEGASLETALEKCTKPELQTLFEEFLPMHYHPKKTPEDELARGFSEAGSARLEQILNSKPQALKSKPSP